MKVCIKIYKTIINFGDNEIENHKFHQYKRHILIKNIDINKIVASKKFSLVKKVLNILLVTKPLRSRPIIHICPKKDDEKKSWKMLKIVSKNSLIVNLYTMKNI